jgi:hypothetical protein
MFDDIFVKYTNMSDLISVDTIKGGNMTELVYNVQVKGRADKQAFLGDLKKLNKNNPVSLLTGYNSVDL